MSFFACEACRLGAVLNILCLLRNEGVLSFRCEPLCFCVYQKVERRAVTTFGEVFEAEKFQCVDFFLSTLLMGGVELV